MNKASVDACLQLGGWRWGNGVVSVNEQKPQVMMMIRHGEYHNESICQIWDQSSFICKCMETA